MSVYDKRRVMRLYSDGKSYVLSSQLIENEKLLIKVVNSVVCINRINNEEWNTMTQSKTNSVGSASFSLVLEAFGCLGLLETSFPTTQNYHQSKSFEEAANIQHCLLFVKDVTSVSSIRKFDILKIADVFLLPLNSDINSNIYSQQTNSSNNSSNVNYQNEIKKFLSSGVFYFSFSLEPNCSFDLTLSSQARHLCHQTNKKFLWNYNLHIPFRRFNLDTNTWLLKIICGCVEIKKIFTLSKSFKACLFSRLSCERVGTRYNCRGLNDDGQCANFVETEQVLYSEDSDEESSFLQIRGSVPVFFEQSGIQVGPHRIKISRGLEACYPAFERHIKSLLQDYGTNIYILNLLGIKGDESYLTQCYSNLAKECPFSMNNQLIYSNFDYHQEIKLNKQALGEKLWPALVHEFYYENHKNSKTDEMFFYFKKDGETDSCVKLQTKFIRTNCMDCLDRTNSVQSYIGIEMLRYQINNFLSENDLNKQRELRELFRQMWIINGDCISKIYTGTGAIQGKSYTQDFSRSLTRAIQNNFLDNNKQDAIETFLFSMSRNYGDLANRVRILMSQNSLRLPLTVLRQMVSNYRQYTEISKCRIAVGTWNINGGLSASEMERLDLNEWLIDGPLFARKSGLGHLDPSIDFSANNLGNIDIFAVGFEEIVDLNAQNIVNASDENASKWYNKLYKFFRKHGNYVPLVIEPLQLVGVCLFVFVLEKHVGAIRDVCVARTKTGLGGAAGNKGGVLIRLIFYNTSICFVASHFAAHQKEIKQRNDDFKQIYENSEFVGQAVTSTSKIDVKSHDYVIWCGDLNYRIDMANDRCRSLISERDWPTLLELDQLSIQRDEENVFKEFNEAPISFPPTYKYNVMEDSYDRSEKCRVPAWTDRILWRRRVLTRQENEDKKFNFGKCLYYGRADVRLSDHRPVSALFELEISKVQPKKLIEILNRIFLEVHGPFQTVLIVNTHTNQMDEKIKKAIIEKFSEYRSFSMIRELKNSLFITYSDGRFAYEAYANLNNYYLEKHDLNLQVKVDNEQNFQKLVEQELMDCLSSLNYITDNSKKFSEVSSTKREVQVADLLGDSFKNDNDEKNESSSSMFYINVPAQIHSSLSITNHMHHLKSKDAENGLQDERHQYHNPLIKALSNSNLNMFDTDSVHSLHINNPSFNSHLNAKAIHSAANLLDISNDEMANLSSKSDLMVPPRRPPPPTGGVKDSNPFEQAFSVQNLPEPLIKIENNATSFGFEDDFGSFSSFQSNSNTTSSNEIAPTRPPPLPPLPISSNSNHIEQPIFSLGEETSKPSFSLFDSSEVQVPIQQQQTQSRTNIANVPVPSRPPPLPPMPVQNSINKNFSSSSSLRNSAPPPLPPLPSTIPKIPSRSSVQPTLPPRNNANNSSSNFNILSQNNQLVDLLGDPNLVLNEDAPFAPPRHNNFK